MISADDERRSTPWYRNLLSWNPDRTWFTVNGDDYLGSGQVDGGLDGKLNQYLASIVSVIQAPLSHFADLIGCRP